MILIIDHFDSFSHNLYQRMAGDLGDVQVVRCDRLTVGDIRSLRPELVVLSPGPRGPKDTGVTLEYLASDFAQTRPTLGICLGFQALGLAWGAEVTLAEDVVHGKTLELGFEAHPLFEGLSSPITVARYHSLGVRRDTLPPGVLNLASHGPLSMVACDQNRPWAGFQFHPESFLTPDGPRLLANAHAQLTGAR